MSDMEIELAVRRLLDAYAHACDTADAAGVAALFVEGGELRVGDGVWTGEGIVDFYASRLDVPTIHTTSGLSWRRRDDGIVDSTCRLLAVEYPEDRTSLALGRYEDELAVQGIDARFVSRRIVVDGRRHVGS